MGATVKVAGCSLSNRSIRGLSLGGTAIDMQHERCEDGIEFSKAIGNSSPITGNLFRSDDPLCGMKLKGPDILTAATLRDMLENDVRLNSRNEM